MQTPRLVAVEIPDNRFVVRVKRGPRLGTIFTLEKGWYYQFDGTLQEGPRCRDPQEALGIMEAVAMHQHLLEPELALSA